MARKRQLEFPIHAILIGAPIQAFFLFSGLVLTVGSIVRAKLKRQILCASS